jgi:hypothetical protein
MLPPHPPASRKVDRSRPVRSSRPPDAEAMDAGHSKGRMKPALRIVGSKRESMVAKMRNRKTHIC